MNRTDLQEVAKRRLGAAESLLKSQHWDSAYYLAGYAVECGLKACIARQFREHDFPDRKIVNDSYTHDLTKLVKIADLERERERAAEASDDFKLNWATVKDWSEESRYEQRSEAQATAILQAIGNAQFGVMQWITQHW
jgi:HEPN domain-containing protein